MTNTDYLIENKKVSYEVIENGYKIYLDSQVWIHQYEPYIPDKSKSYEENAVAQIEEIYNGFQQALNEQEQTENE